MRTTQSGTGKGDAIRFRPARKEDAREIASLFLMSSDGMAAYIWAHLAEPGADLLDVGAERYARENTAFSYENCHIAEVTGRVAGMLHAFEMVPREAPEADPILRPYSELEDAGSLYISGIAIHPEYRRRGLARELMALAESLAEARGLARISLICFDRNVPACALYASLGFREVDRRPIVPHPSLHYSDGHALLLVHDVSRN